jgi:hypothetical protein
VTNSFAAISVGYKVLQLNEHIAQLEFVEPRVSRRDLSQFVSEAMRSASQVVKTFEGDPHIARLVFEREQQLRKVRKRTEKLYRPKNQK